MPRARITVIHVIAALLVPFAGGCFSAAPHQACLEGEFHPCSSACGPGAQTCDGTGALGPCVPALPVDCSPGEGGHCTMDDGEEGLWACTEACELGQCRAGCEPGATAECETECGPGTAVCQGDGRWGSCVEVDDPECRPGDLARCRGTETHRRCRADCTYAPCEEVACTAGQSAICVERICGFEVCEGGGWSGCNVECLPGELWGDSLESARCGLECHWGPGCHPGWRLPNLPIPTPRDGS